jgi:hypothetical protein
MDHAVLCGLPTSGQTRAVPESFGPELVSIFAIILLLHDQVNTHARTRATQASISRLGKLSQSARPWYCTQGNVCSTQGHVSWLVRLRPRPALLDVLQSAELNETQQEAMQTLRIAIQSLDLARVLNGEDDDSVANSV